FKSVICLSKSTICFSSFSSWLGTEATYAWLAFAALGGAAAFGLSSWPFPTTEIFPVDLDRSSFVRILLVFLVSVAAVASCGLDAGGGAPAPVVWATTGTVDTSATTGSGRERRA